MDSISQSFLDMYYIRTAQLDSGIEKLDRSFRLIEKALRSAGNKILGIAYEPQVVDDFVVTANGATTPALNDASFVLGSSLLLVVMHRLGKAVSANALELAESECSEEELDYCSTLRGVFVSSGILKH